MYDANPSGLIQEQEKNLFSKLLNFFLNSNTSKITTLVIILAAIPLTVILSQQQQNVQQKASGLNNTNLSQQWIDPIDGKTYEVTEAQKAALEAVAAIAPDGKIDPRSEEYKTMTNAFVNGPKGDCISNCNETTVPNMPTTNTNPTTTQTPPVGTPNQQAAQSPAVRCSLQFSQYCTVNDAASGSTSCNFGNNCEVMRQWYQCIPYDSASVESVYQSCKQQGNPTTTPTASVIPAIQTLDINRDGVVSILDYNTLISCSIFSKDNGAVCGNFRTNADLDSNGMIDQIDYNIFLRGYAKSQ